MGGSILLSVPFDYISISIHESNISLRGNIPINYAAPIRSIFYNEDSSRAIPFGKFHTFSSPSR